MALNLSLSNQLINPMGSSDPTRLPATRSARWVELSNSNGSGSWRVTGERKRGMIVKVKGSLDATSAAEAEVEADVAGLVGKVTEVNQDTFWPIVNASLDKSVVLDMYTQWCGPCKVMAPKFKQLAEKYQDVVFLKLDCNQENKSLAKELGIRVVPTFKILKGGKIVEEVTGAKFDNLVTAIEAARSS